MPRPSESKDREQGKVRWRPDFLARAVKNGIDDAFINQAEEFAKHLSAVSKSKIRDVYGMVKRIEARAAGQLLDDTLIEELRMVRPRLSYAVKREKKVQRLEQVIKPAVQAVTEQGLDSEERRKRFRRFCQGFEAILAYHIEKKGAR